MLKMQSRVLGTPPLPLITALPAASSAMQSGESESVQTSHSARHSQRRTLQVLLVGLPAQGGEQEEKEVQSVAMLLHAPAACCRCWQHTGQGVPAGAAAELACTKVVGWAALALAIPIRRKLCVPAAQHAGCGYELLPLFRSSFTGCLGWAPQPPPPAMLPLCHFLPSLLQLLTGAVLPAGRCRRSSHTQQPTRCCREQGPAASCGLLAAARSARQMGLPAPAKRCRGKGQPVASDQCKGHSLQAGQPFRELAVCCSAKQGRQGEGQGENS